MTTIGRKYILDFGPGYTRDHFFMATTPVTTQLWQSGRPLNAEVLRTTKVKTMLFAYSGCLALNAYLILVVSRRFHSVTLRVGLLPTLP